MFRLMLIYCKYTFKSWAVSECNDKLYCCTFVVFLYVSTFNIGIIVQLN